MCISKGGITTEELLKELGVEFAADLAKISMEEAVKSYNGMRRCERRNVSTVTDSNGSYKFISVYPGTYNITASRRGFWYNSSSVTVTGTPASESYTLNLTLWLKGDLNNNGKPADNADVSKMENASIGEISPDWRYDLNRNGIVADAGDLAMIKDASAGNIIVLE